MILCSFDLETTGLDPVKDRPIEVGAILYSTGQKRVLESAGYLIKTDVPISEEITRLTGITQGAVNKFGFASLSGLETVLDMAEVADAFVGQNVVRFDKRFLDAWAVRHDRRVPDKLWIDTRTDLPVSVEPKTLKYLAADHGFLPSSSHAALADCETVLQIIQMYDIDEIVERAKSPVVILKAHVSFDTNALAKKRKYGWYSTCKLWYKIVKQADVEKEVSEAPFDVSFVTDISVEELWYS